MRILHLGKFYPMSGGMERVVLDIVNDFSSRGILCDMLCVATDFPHDIAINDCGHIFTTASLFHAKSVSVSPAMISRLRKICDDYDIIHIHCPNPMANLALFLCNYTGKVVLHWHSDILKQKTLLNFYKPLQTWLINRADVILGTSQAYLQNSPYLQNVKYKLRTIPLGVSRIVPMQQGVEKIKDRYGRKKIVFSLGRLISYKGFEYLIDAASYLDNDYVILIGGTGPLYTSLSERITRQNLNDKVFLVGYIPDDMLCNYYGACDVFCLSSIWKTEAFGLVQIEAMSCGKPVIATDIAGSGVPWVNKHGYSGLNVPVENSKALAEAIIEITSSREVYLRYSFQAQKRYNDLFTKQRMLHEYESVYNELMSDL